MANLVRTAKSGSDWTASELDAYDIRVTDLTKGEFFGDENLPFPEALATFAEHEDRTTVQDVETRKLIHFLDLAMTPKVGQESAVDQFAYELLKRLRYDSEDKIIIIRRAFPFVICGETRQAQTDLCIVDDNEVVLLVQEDKRLSSNKDPEPQLIAEAIAAFNNNNAARIRDLKLPPHESITFPAITLIGTSPAFYKIKVTKQLSEAVRNGTYPSSPTHVERYIPTLPRRYSEGMRPLSNRVEILKCYEAFKRFV